MSENIKRLLEVMDKLRDPDTGCPWDIKQTFASIAPYTIEETYELVEAIENNDIPNIKEELGDVLFQIVFHAQMAKESGLFDFYEVADCVASKMIERHPHVFDTRTVKDADEVLLNWDKDKQAKKKQSRVMEGISTAIPALTRAMKLQKRASRVGFDWDNADGIIAKIKEEIGELEKETAKDSKEHIQEELGDVLFAVVNLCRKLGVDPESALRQTNRKFQTRFTHIETALEKSGKRIQDASLEEMEALWQEAKESVEC
ncbi:MAG: nucleoside triphosphate pyrophosphohydrolase [Alphaproteobacteria bacterium]|nr:nucleoside triphosphate pyrophosphohydrolase [Alphaproteobacteria bacterium]